MKIDHLYKQLEKNDQWIHNADTKLSIILTFLGVLGGITLAQGDKLPSPGKLFFSFENLTLVFFFSSLCAIAWGFFNCIKGVTATLKNPRRGLWFFVDVAQFKHWSYFKKSKEKEQNEDQKDDLYSQIHITAQIALQKFKYVNKSLRNGVWALILYILYFILVSIVVN